ncbi:type VI secretion system protein TssA [Vibrio campbellii]|uniref:type VI secretion system protein TssA n=1 Tax=Vibrio harveyi group TaxID=717610 RepID=UPI0005ED9095|nr:MULTISPECIES: type VI secretion system protein TssA [Vibrio harveyi group]AYO11723.1 type VI secretion system protein TssA [Vibrio campbellii]OQQ01725.1 type VI secretion protein [Vibrio campbellii]
MVDPKSVSDSSRVFDWLAPVLLPVSEERPTGVDPREDVSPQSAYYRLKDSRMAARNAERNAIIEEESILTHTNLWRVFIDEVPDILSRQSKDLEFVAWLIEALTRLYGFRGMGVGYEIASNFIDNFWEQLYPMPDEDGMETRISSIIGLNGIDSEGTLIFPLASIPLTDMGVEQPYAFWEYQQAIELERLDEDKRRYKVEQGAVEMSKINDTVKSTSDEFYRELISDLEFAMVAFSQFSQKLDDAVGDVTPSSYISKKLDSIHSALKHLLGVRFQAPSEVTEVIQLDPTEDEEAAILQGQNGALLMTNMQSREQAIEQLQKVADFFRESEPHSPVSYSIEQIIRWCGMPLPELLAELISDGDAKRSYFRLVGIAEQNEN